MIDKALKARSDKRKKNEVIRTFERDYDKFHRVFEKYSYAQFID